MALFVGEEVKVLAIFNKTSVAGTAVDGLL